MVLGKFSTFRLQGISHFPNIRLHRNVENMADLMLLCDIAITAGGSTMYELCACRLTAVSFSFADNQLPGVLCMDRNGLIPYAGDVRVEKKDTFKDMLELLQGLKVDYKKRKKIEALMQSFVDGLGGQRLADAIALMK